MGERSRSEGCRVLVQEFGEAAIDAGNARRSSWWWSGSWRCVLAASWLCETPWRSDKGVSKHVEVAHVQLFYYLVLHPPQPRRLVTKAQVLDVDAIVIKCWMCPCFNDTNPAVGTWAGRGALASTP